MRRRSFLKQLGLGTITVTSVGGLRGSLLGIEPFQRPVPGKLRLSLAAYSLRKYLAADADESKQMNLFDFVDYCHQQGLSGAELTSYYFPSEVTDEYLLELKRHCHLRGVSISGGAIRNDFCQLDAGKLEQDLEHTRRWVDYYALLGAPAIRIFAGQPNSSEAMQVTLDRCAKNCEIACRYAADKGIMLALENHGGVTAQAEGLLNIVKQVQSPAFGINFDSGNFRTDKDPYAELQAIAPYAINAQIKVEMTQDGKTVETDLERVLGILRDAGYSGWVALEYEAKQDPLEAIPGWLERLKPLVDN